MAKAPGLIFLGPPGSGKGTQAQSLSEQLQIPHISTGEMLRQAIASNTSLGQQAQSYVERGELVPDELLLDLIRETLTQPEAQQGWILDGFPRNVTQAAFLDKLLEQLPDFAQQAINLEVPDEVLVERLLLRGRQDDTEGTIRRRLEVYRQQTQPVIEYYEQQGKLYSVDGNRSLAEVSSSLQQVVVA